ncbi:MAG: conserved rane protein of unknown function [Clostridiales bacterium]|jgi:hypothetical protein|nr:conserved rane protein of unknown function [Clostridiales bacterium]
MGKPAGPDAAKFTTHIVFNKYFIIRITIDFNNKINKVSELIYMPKKNKVKFRANNKGNKTRIKILIIVASITMLQAILLGYASLSFMGGLSLFWAMLIVLVIIFIGIFFDILGIAVTAASETPFNSMAASKVPGAKESIKILRNAGTVANFCNDVIGDICGIVSGSAAGAIVIKLNTYISIQSTLLSVLVTALIATITVTGKAVGKDIAITNANAIVFKMGATVRVLTLKRIFSKNEKL